jgi:hypothetical protein
MNNMMAPVVPANTRIAGEGRRVRSGVAKLNVIKPKLLKREGSVARRGEASE